MIISRAPLRLPLGGGGTDLPFYSSRFGGFLLSVAIDKYVYTMAHRPSWDDVIRVKTREHEEVSSLSDLHHDWVRAALERMDVRSRIQLVFVGDVSGGTGLGTSGAYLVSLLHVLAHFQGVPMGSRELAEAACDIEMNILGRPVGKQDQYMAALGGIQVLYIGTDGRVTLGNPIISRDTLEGLKVNLLLFYSGVKRKSGEILGEQKRLAEEGDSAIVEHYHRIKEIGYLSLQALEQGDLVSFGELMHRHWEVKRELAGGVSNPEIDMTYHLAREKGALGGKIVGAGGGGFFLFFCPAAQKKAIRHALMERGLREITFSYDWQGSVVIPVFPESEPDRFLQPFHSER